MGDFGITPQLEKVSMFNFWKEQPISSSNTLKETIEDSRSESHTRSCAKIGPVHQTDHVQKAQSEHKATIDPPDDAPLFLGGERIYTLVIGKCKHSIFKLVIVLDPRLFDVRKSFSHDCCSAGLEEMIDKVAS
jgi:hypothetical protein